jgi:hypothetical protein
MKTNKTRKLRLSLEALEDRSVPTTASFANGVLSVFGTESAERITVRQDGSRITVEGVGWIDASRVNSVVIKAYGGNDTVDCRTLTKSTRMEGGSGNDLLMGGSAGDNIYGGYDNDKLFGGGGYDYLYGEDGNDFMDDGNRSGNESVDGGAGYDFNADVWAIGGATYTDIVQQGSPTCSFMASLAAVAKGYANSVNFANWIRYDGHSDGTPYYTVWFRSGAGWTTQQVTFDGAVQWADAGTAVSQPTKVAEGEYWVLLMQRAWKQMHGNDGIAWPHEAMAALTGSTGSWYRTITDSLKDTLRSAVSSGKAIVAATGSNPASPLVGNHAYTVLATWGTNSNFWVQVRNPWGKDGPNGAVEGADDGVFWVRWDTFKTMAAGLWIR